MLTVPIPHMKLENHADGQLIFTDETIFSPDVKECVSSNFGHM
jgi:hypothetical protein